jgi:hypothetical protein
MDFKSSEHWTISDRLADFGQFFLDDGNCIGQSVEGNLGEHVVLNLILHSSHQDEPEEIGLLIIPAGYNLVVDEAMFDILIIPDFSFMISDQDKRRVKPSEKVSQQEVQQVVIVVKNDHVVDNNPRKFHLNFNKNYVIEFQDRTHQRVKSPLQVQELVQVDFVIVLDVIVIKFAVCENVVHIVLWAPPLQAVSACYCCHHPAVFHE